jgi:anti-sigma factor RsiW
MDHDEVVRQKLTERYLLDELDPQARDQFEEHFFSCADCALDIRAGSEFVAQSKTILVGSPVPADRETVRIHQRPRRDWFGWLRPVYAVPALVILLVVIAYQNLVTYPRQQAALVQPQILPWASVAVGTWGSSGPAISVQEGKGFLLFVRIPPAEAYSHYIADLYNPAGKLVRSLTIPTAGAQDQWPLLIPKASREAGSYRISVRGITAAGESKNIGSASFTLHTQQ